MIATTANEVFLPSCKTQSLSSICSHVPEQFHSNYRRVSLMCYITDAVIFMSLMKLTLAPIVLSSGMKLINVECQTFVFRADISNKIEQFRDQIIYTYSKSTLYYQDIIKVCILVLIVMYYININVF